MSSNVQSQAPTYPQAYANVDTMLHNAAPPQNDPLGLNGYAMPDTQTSRMGPLRQSTLQQTSHGSTIPISPYPDFTLPYQNTSREPVQRYEGSLDSRLESPQDIKPTFDDQLQGSYAELSGKRTSVASARGPRPSISTVGNTGGMKRKGSVEDSEPTSPTSSRGFSGQGSNESVPHAHNHDGDDGEGPDYKNLDDRNKPAWSELKTKAGKERKRLPLACIACRRKKIRCSGEKPACKHCLRSRIPCVYKVTARKAAPRTDYMAMLDKRLKRMEERVIKIIPAEEAGSLPNIARAIVKPAPPGQNVKSNNSTKKRAAEEAFGAGAELDEWANTGINNAGVQLGRATKAPDTDETRLLTEGTEFLPPQEIQQHLSEVFFDCLYGQSYHILHKPSFMRRLSAGKIPPVLILAVCAIAARFSTHPQVSGEPAFLRGESWAKPARDIALRRYDEPNITILTVLLILGLHEFGTCQGGRSWMLGGMAVRMAYALQLHKELEHDPSVRKHDKSTALSFTDREIRRRTMWSCFLMDRFNSSGTGRPTFASEDDIKVQLPIKESHFQMEIPGPTEGLNGEVLSPVSSDPGHLSDPKENMGIAAYMIRIIAIWGRVIRYMNLGGKHQDPHPWWDSRSNFAALKKQAKDYQDSLPESLRYNPENLKNHAAEKLANQFLFLHLAHSQVVLFLHCFAIPTTPGGKAANEMPKEFLSEAGHIAVEAASQISNVLGEATGYLIAAPFAGYCAFFSSTVHVWGMFSKNSQLEASSQQNLACNVKYLSKMKKYWGMFHYMTENLKESFRQYADASSKGSTARGSAERDASVFQYGDWFDQYPRGVSDTDYEDPASADNNENGNDAVLSQKSDLQTVKEFFDSLQPPATATHHRKVSKRHGKGGIHPDQHLPLFPTNIKTEQEIQQSRHNHMSHGLVNMPMHNQQQNINPNSYSQELFTPTQSSFSDPSGYPPNVMALQNPGLPFTELERHMVYGAYAGTDPTGTSSASSLNGLAGSNNHAPNPNNGLWDGMMDYSQALAASQSYSDLSNSAWFMPFNLNPPDIGGEGEMGSYGLDVNDANGGGDAQSMSGGPVP